ncbi:MAG: transcription antitermination factor NusB [Candidatus Cloacimonetes bacterium]|nr:transcription antitermination factor NusB [Candidatus Cloacimonadota bacterium]MDY0366298.1 transcription antitermination factor NusB [Candidatus Syntrophosphaera sp.]HOY83691.1 transcription antitermination factor NusB [Candidatus Syntrophosphaera sp.]
MGLRRKSRELAAQTLYALDFRELDPEFLEYGMLNSYPELLNELAELEKLQNSAPVVDFADDLVKNAIINRTEIIQEIEKHSEHWSVANISRMDRGVLHIAVYELLFTDTPPAVVINEALEIAKKFCGEGAVKFLNGILDSLNKELRARESIEGLPG